MLSPARSQSVCPADASQGFLGPPGFSLSLMSSPAPPVCLPPAVSLPGAWSLRPPLPSVSVHPSTWCSFDPSLPTLCPVSMRSPLPFPLPVFFLSLPSIPLTFNQIHLFPVLSLFPEPSSLSHSLNSSQKSWARKGNPILNPSFSSRNEALYIYDFAGSLSQI